MCSLKASSIDAADDLPRHASTVLIPCRAILFAAAPVVTAGAIGQENGQVDHVEIGQEVGESGGQAPCKREQDFRHVVKVPRNAPPTGGKQEAFVLPAVSSHVRSMDQFGRTSPHGCGAIHSPHSLTLSVGGIVDVDRRNPKKEDR